MVTEKPDVNRRALFGGAMSAIIPLAYADISTVREVPDNQEVFAHAETDRSVIIELLELQRDIPSNQTAAEFHLHNIAEESSALSSRTHKVVTLPASDFPSLREGDPQVNITAAYGTQTVSKFKDAAEHANEVDVYVACVRLARKTTDLLVVFNDPRVLHPQGSSARIGSVVGREPGGREEEGRDGVLKEALNSLRIHEWGLLDG